MSNSSRRQFVMQLVAGGLTLSWKPAFAADKTTLPDLCRLAAEQEEGPFYIQDEALRSNLIEDRPGVPLVLRIQLFDVRRCAPLQQASLEIWSCDAMGEYSGYSRMFSGPPPDGKLPPPHGQGDMHGGPGHRPGGMPPGPPPHQPPDNHKTFLRGRQTSDAQGRLEFTTLYPGCYEGRVNHIHVKVRLNSDDRTDGRVVHTGQIFLPETITDAVLALPPYAAHNIRRTQANEDHIYTDQHGRDSIASLRQIEPGSIEKGYVASISFGIDPEATPAPV